MSIKKENLFLFLAFFSLLVTFLGETWAASTRRNSVVVDALKAKVRAKVESSNLYDQECYEAYFGCMDQFCQSDNESGGSCICSDDYSQYDSTMKKIEQNNDEANRIKTIEIEKVQAGADADILFTGERRYDESGNVLSVDEKQSSVEKRRAVRQLELEKLFSEDEEFSDTLDNVTGRDLYDGSRELCLQKVPEKCDKDMPILTNIYLTQIRNDCTALSKVINDMLKKSQQALVDANQELRAARSEMLEKVNEYDRGTCMIEFKKCMQTDDACGTDWNRCVSAVASENMQNNMAVSTRGTNVSRSEKFDISNSVMEMLSSKRTICERVLDKCMANRDFVWTDFLRDVAPDLKIAEAKAESGKRQSCLTDISNCIQKACKDDIEGKGTATMDACLARPEMARSFCKVEIDPCERMEPQIWDYVVSKLAAMRVDACTNEVKQCFTSEDRCGSDFSKCIGMDYEYLHDICPVDKLVVCKQTKKDFKMSDIDDMLMGFFLNVDNSALAVCQEKIDKKMQEICGSVTDCNKFASDDTIGTNSLQSVKDGDIYRISGMLSFGMIKMGDGNECEGEDCKVIPFGKIGVLDYITEVRKKNTMGNNSELVNGIIDSIESELKNIEGTINRTIDLIESDQEIQYCINGRDLSQITGGTRGSRSNTTTARFPNLLNSKKMLIASAALHQAQTNYNTKYNQLMSQATKDASADVAQVICHQMGSGMSDGKKALAKVFSSASSETSQTTTGMISPFSIMVEIGKGIGIDGLLASSTGTSVSGAKGGVKDMHAGISLDNIGFTSSGVKSQGNVTTKTRAIFTRETRNCHYCYQISTSSCASSKSNGFFGIGSKISSECSVDAQDEVCEDIQL